jgi:hypothetical protein
MEKPFFLSYERYKPAYSRPLGKGPFFDFAAAAGWRLKLGPKLPRAAPAAAAHRDESEDRWFGEGGNTQTHVSRRAYKRL